MQRAHHRPFQRLASCHLPMFALALESQTNNERATTVCVAMMAAMMKITENQADEYDGDAGGHVMMVTMAMIAGMTMTA
eukprot:scaffold478394_cov20-Prasinocladus_malaysianus.AAC.1